MAEQKFEKKRILIVEDDLEWAETIEEYLRDEGYGTITIVKTKEEADKNLKDYIFSFAIIDLNLKDESTHGFEEWDGVKLVREIDKLPSDRRPTVIIITAYRKENSEKFLTLEHYNPGFLIKQEFDEKEFLRIIKTNMPSKV